MGMVNTVTPGSGLWAWFTQSPQAVDYGHGSHSHTRQWTMGMAHTVTPGSGLWAQFTQSAPQSIPRKQHRREVNCRCVGCDQLYLLTVPRYELVVLTIGILTQQHYAYIHLIVTPLSCCNQFSGVLRYYAIGWSQNILYFSHNLFNIISIEQDMNIVT